MPAFKYCSARSSSALIPTSRDVDLLILLERVDQHRADVGLGVFRLCKFAVESTASSYGSGYPNRLAERTRQLDEGIPRFRCPHAA